MFQSLYYSRIPNSNTAVDRSGKNLCLDSSQILKRIGASLGLRMEFKTFWLSEIFLYMQSSRGCKSVQGDQERLKPKPSYKTLSNFILKKPFV